MKSLDNLKNEVLFSHMDETIAAGIFEGKTYPWEVLADIGAFILELGKTLSADEYDRQGEGKQVSAERRRAKESRTGNPGRNEGRSTGKGTERKRQFLKKTAVEKRKLSGASPAWRIAFSSGMAGRKEKQKHRNRNKEQHDRQCLVVSRLRGKYKHGGYERGLRGIAGAFFRGAAFDHGRSGGE